MTRRTGERVALAGKQFTVKEVDFELDNGKQFTFQIIEKPDSAMLVPIDSQGRLVLVSEYFVAIDQRGLGLPKGKMEPGEDPANAANRELREEVGMKAGRLDKLGVLTLSPGYLTQKTHVFLARDLSPSKLEGDPDEEIKVVTHPFKEFEKLIESGKLNEARMISALYMTRAFLEKERGTK